MLNATAIDAALVLSVQTTWGGCIFIRTARRPATSRIIHEENILLFVVWLAAVIFVNSHFSSKSLFGHECWEQLSVYL
jgi:hypothetical protein